MTTLADHYPLSLPACHGRLDALRHALRIADDALSSCTPYVRGVIHDPDAHPWRTETATQVWATLRAARDQIAAELEGV